MNEDEIKNTVEFPKEISLRLLENVIKEVVTSLEDLKQSHSWTNYDIKDLIYKSLDERFGGLIDHDGEGTSTIPAYGFLETIFNNLLEELEKEQSFDKFIKNISVLIQMDSDEKILLETVANKQSEVNELQLAIENDKNESVDKIVNSMEEIGRIKDEIENLCIESKIKLAYVKSWQNSKIEMRNVVLSSELQKIEEKIQQYKSKIDIENQVHGDFMKAVTEIQQELQEQIVDWERKYDESMKSMTEKINILREKQNEQLNELENLKAKHDKRKQEIQDWEKYKIEQEKIRLEKERINNAAIKIQAWWKGTMVRKGFGRFRKKKEKKQKKSAEKQKQPLKK
ncbi:unnamed protein product [Phyllotreta striolata]|uniref:Dynein regulatory complex protein 9 n=1 Tax=Phyllotreta striolata TaxID=444603 RepID=A0A9N9XJ23_PHYSR|nr:unnamed protein product [Phyllotreta striolata]